MSEINQEIENAKSTARDFVSIAEENAERALYMGDVRAEGILALGKEKVEAYRLAEMEKAKVEVENACAKIISDGNAYIEKMENYAKAKMETLADYIVNELLK